MATYSVLETEATVPVSPTRRNILVAVVVFTCVILLSAVVPWQQRRLNPELLTATDEMSVGEKPKPISFPPIEPSRPTTSDSRVIHFNAAQGTTGTRTFFDAICSLGIASVHFTESCFPNVAPAVLQKGLNSHRKAKEAFASMKSCINNSECTFLELIEIVESIKQHISEVIAAGISINDTPYPFFPLFVIESARRQGIVPFVELTERDPQKWMESRMEKHPHTVVCREFFAWDQPERFEYGGFDIDYCLHLALQRSPHPPKWASDVLAISARLLDEAGDNASKVEQVRRNNMVAFNQSQQGLGRYASYKINFWERSHRVTSDEIAKEVATAAISLNVSLPERSVNFVKTRKGESKSVKLWNGA